MADLSRLAAADPITISDNVNQATITGTSLNVNVTNTGSGAVATKEQNTGTATLTNVAQNASNATIVAANSSRRRTLIFNTATNASLFLKYGTTATTTTSFTVKIPPGSYWEMPDPPYTGQMDGIWDAGGSGNAIVTDLS